MNGKPCCHPPPVAPLWLRSARNTLHCLVGCSLGDIAAMSLIPLAWPAVPFAALAAIAVVCGITSSLILETLVLHAREAMGWRQSFAIAWRMSLISMVAMELAMNVTDWLIMGGQRMALSDPDYWLAWIPALVAGFLAAWPYNHFQLRRHGKGCH
jgi:hypothetical protein